MRVLDSGIGVPDSGTEVQSTILRSIWPHSTHLSTGPSVVTQTLEGCHHYRDCLPGYLCILDDGGMYVCYSPDTGDITPTSGSKDILSRSASHFNSVHGVRSSELGRSTSAGRRPSRSLPRIRGHMTDIQSDRFTSARIDNVSQANTHIAGARALLGSSVALHLRHFCSPLSPECLVSRNNQTSHDVANDAGINSLSTCIRWTFDSTSGVCHEVEVIRSFTLLVGSDVRFNNLYPTSWQCHDMCHVHIKT